LQNEDFPKSLVKYISNQDIKKLSGDATALFNEIYRENQYIGLITKEFMEAFFDCFDVLDKEKDLDTSVRLICHFNSKENLSKIVLEVYNNHKYSTNLVDYLLFLLNKTEDKEIIFDICKLISDLLDLTKSSLFYTNDLQSFISICVKTLESTYTDELRFHFLNILNKLLSYKNYFETRYKMDEMVEILENYEMNDHVEERNQQLSKEILEKIENSSK
jgi:hypothetical protein